MHEGLAPARDQADRGYEVLARSHERVSTERRRAVGSPTDGVLESPHFTVFLRRLEHERLLDTGACRQGPTSLAACVLTHNADIAPTGSLDQLVDAGVTTGEPLRQGGLDRHGQEVGRAPDKGVAGDTEASRYCGRIRKAEAIPVPNGSRAGAIMRLTGIDPNATTEPRGHAVIRDIDDGIKMGYAKARPHAIAWFRSM